jgi:RNA-binding protein
LTGKQRSYLRSLANNIPAIFQVGKNGLEANSIRQFDEALEARELVKASVMRNSPLTAREAADALAGGIGSGCDTGIGQPLCIVQGIEKQQGDPASVKRIMECLSWNLGEV